MTIASDLAARIRTAQSITTTFVSGETFTRRPYGFDGDDFAVFSVNCRDCGAARGQYHIPQCCIEQCAKCGGQAISCPCGDGSRKRRA